MDRCRWFGAFLAGGTALVLATASLAQTKTAAPNTIAGPDYTSGVSSGLLSSGNYNTPEADGRPGVKFFAYGVAAFRKGDLKHALDMFKVSASWGYKPAEYNLGVIYFQGEGGVPVDRPLGTAWMFLAAERNTPAYVSARHMMVTSLDDGERSKALALLQQMEKKYGDKVALRRAKAQWAFAKSNQTGSRVGGAVGELRVGVPGAHGAFATSTSGPGGTPTPIIKHSAMDVLTGGSIDGSVAYHQFSQSDNPYSPVFVKNRKGTVSVEPLQQAKSGKGSAKATTKASASDSSDTPKHP